MLIDASHVFLAIHGTDFMTRQCGIYFEDSRVGAALNQWLDGISRRAVHYEKWRSAVNAELHGFGGSRIARA
jgi:hypothetical protein